MLTRPRPLAGRWRDPPQPLSSRASRARDGRPPDPPRHAGRAAPGRRHGRLRTRPDEPRGLPALRAGHAGRHPAPGRRAGPRAGPDHRRPGLRGRGVHLARALPVPGPGAARAPAHRGRLRGPRLQARGRAPTGQPPGPARGAVRGAGRAVPLAGPRRVHRQQRAAPGRRRDRNVQPLVRPGAPGGRRAPHPGARRPAPAAGRAARDRLAAPHPVTRVTSAVWALGQNARFRAAGRGDPFSAPFPSLGSIRRRPPRARGAWVVGGARVA